LPERLSIIFAASEVEGFSKSGGLADVARALPLHLKSMGHDVRIVTPLYRLIPENHKTETIIPRLGVPLGSEESWCAVRQLEMEGVVDGKMISVPVYFIEHDHYFFRSGYYDDGLHEYPDNAARFGFFLKSSFAALQGIGMVSGNFSCKRLAHCSFAVLSKTVSAGN